MKPGNGQELKSLEDQARIRLYCCDGSEIVWGQVQKKRADEKVNVLSHRLSDHDHNNSRSVGSPGHPVTSQVRMKSLLPESR